MGYKVPQKWIFACGECGCVFTINARKQTNQCPMCQSKGMLQIEGLNYYELKCL